MVACVTNVRHQHSSSDLYGISRWLNATLEESWYALPYGQMHIQQRWSDWVLIKFFFSFSFLSYHLMLCSFSRYLN